MFERTRGNLELAYSSLLVLQVAVCRTTGCSREGYEREVDDVRGLFELFGKIVMCSGRWMVQVFESLGARYERKGDRMFICL